MRILDESQKIICSRKGSAAVLICVLFSSLVLAVSVIVDCAGWEVSKSYGERMTYLACRSILAQYDRNLWEDYGRGGKGSSILFGADGEKKSGEGREQPSDV